MNTALLLMVITFNFGLCSQKYQRFSACNLEKGGSLSHYTFHVFIHIYFDKMSPYD